MFLAKKNFEYHARDQKCHFGKIEKLPKWHFWTWAWNSKKILTRSILLKHYGNGNKKFFSQLVPGSAKSRTMQEKVQKGDFLKKDSRELKSFSCFRFLWISRRPGTLNWERVVFLPSKSLYRKCAFNICISGLHSNCAVIISNLSPKSSTELTKIVHNFRE